MGLGEGGLGQLGLGQDFPVPQIGCNPLLRDQLGRFWALGVGDDGSLTITLTSIQVNHQQGPFLGSGHDIWQLSVDASSLGNEGIQLTKATPPTILGTLTYIPLVSSVGGAWALTVSSGDLLVTATDFLFPDIIPRQPDVTMSIYGNAFPLTPLICTTCGNASVTASADLSLWCCTCSSFVPPEDTNIIVVLDE